MANARFSVGGRMAQGVVASHCRRGPLAFRPPVSPERRHRAAISGCFNRGHFSLGLSRGRGRQGYAIPASAGRRRDRALDSGRDHGGNLRGSHSSGLLANAIHLADEERPCWHRPFRAGLRLDPLLSGFGAGIADQFDGGDGWDSGLLVPQRASWNDRARVTRCTGSLRPTLVSSTLSERCRISRCITVVISPFAVVLLALVASLLPAQRAASIDPMKALRRLKRLRKSEFRTFRNGY